jgi:phosphoglycolate phosphatase
LPAISAGGKRFECDLVIFDMDGTLLDAKSRLLGLAEARVEAMKGVVGEEVIELWSKASGVDLEARKLDLHGPLAGAPRREDLIVMATVLCLNGWRWREARTLAEEIYNTADEIQAEKYRATFYPGVEAKLREMRNAGLKLAIATNAPRVSAEDIMRSMGADGLFEALVGADEVDRPKPAPDMILLACEKCGCKVNETIYFGDMPEDMNAGRQASVKAVIAVKSELVPVAEIERLADAVIDSVRDIQVL